MTFFTDATSAIDEAVFLAEQTDQAHCVVSVEDGFGVESYANAWYSRMTILETVKPLPLEEAA